MTGVAISNEQAVAIAAGIPPAAIRAYIESHQSEFDEWVTHRNTSHYEAKLAEKTTGSGVSRWGNDVFTGSS